LESVSDIDLNITNNSGATPLICAISIRSSECVKLLLDKGADIEYSCDGYTPLMLAAQEGLFDIVQILINNKADINAKHPDNGLSVLMAAARDGHLEIVNLLLANGVDVEAATTEGSTALMIARYFKQKQVVEILEKHLGIYNYGIAPEILNRTVTKFVDDEDTPF
jgi:ankyrin repeat protein